MIVDLVTVMATKWLMSGSIYKVNPLDIEMVHVPGRTEWDSAGFYCTTQNVLWFKTYELFIPAIFHLICSDHG